MVYLHVDRELIRQRMQDRKHFFDTKLLDSQFDALEEPDNVLTESSIGTDRALRVSIDQSPDVIVAEIERTIHPPHHSVVW